MRGVGRATYSSPPSSSPLFEDALQNFTLEDALQDYCNLHLKPNTQGQAAGEAS